MKTIFRFLFLERNLLSMTATTWGMLTGYGLLIPMTSLLLSLLGGSQAVVVAGTVAMAVVTLPFCLLIIRHEWRHGHVNSLRMFLMVFANALVYCVLLPVIIPVFASRVVQEVQKIVKTKPQPHYLYRSSAAKRVQPRHEAGIIVIARKTAKKTEISFSHRLDNLGHLVGA